MIFFGGDIMKLLSFFILLAITTIPNRFSYAAKIECTKYIQTDLSSEMKAELEIEAEFNPLGLCSSFYINGKIVEGDYQRISNYIKPSSRIFPYVYINSAGGNVYEAFKIGGFFRRYLIRISAPSQSPEGGFYMHIPSKGIVCSGVDCGCASACALIWFGAVDRTGVIGLHRPKILDESYKKSSPDKASRQYKEVLNQIKTYLTEMEAPNALIDYMVGTASHEIKWVKDSSLEHPPSYIEWVSASCGPYPREAILFSSELKLMKHDGNNLTKQERITLGSLKEAIQGYFMCEKKIKTKHLKNIEKPL